MFYSVFLYAILIAFPAVESGRILVLAPFLGKSHSIFINAIVSGLADKGHDITLVTSNLIVDPPSNIKQIDANNDEAFMKMDKKIMYNMDSMPFMVQAAFIWSVMVKAVDSYLSVPAVKRLIVEDKSHYDLVIGEIFFQESFFAFAAKYQAPLVLLGTTTHWDTIDRFMGNPSTLSYLSHEFGRAYGHLNLYERWTNFWVGMFHNLGNRFYVIPKQDELIVKHFSSLSKPLPTVRDLVKNVSLVLFNTHFTFDMVKPTVPGVIEVGGVHLKPAAKLPENIKKFLDDATDGVIYFSLGSNLLSKDMPKEKLDIFIKVFSTLKQRILWKWEDDNPPFKLKNVMTGKWFPQSDILAHPKIRVFITQTGMLSTQEAVHRGVPMIGIPVLGDQHLNIAKLVYHGMGIELPYSEISEEKLNDAINKALNDPKYAKSAKEISNRFHDQMNTPLENAVYWIEYVMRHKGAKFMKSRLPETPLYQYYFLDVYAILSVIILFVLFIFRLLINCICRKKSKVNVNTNINKSKKNK